MADKMGLLGRALLGAAGGAAQANLERFEQEGADKRSRALLDYKQKYALELEALRSSNNLMAAKLRESGAVSRFETGQAAQTERAGMASEERRFLSQIEAEEADRRAAEKIEAAQKKPLSPLADLQADVDAERITQKQMDAALALKTKDQPMLEFKRRLDAAKALALADPTSYRQKPEGGPMFGAFGEEVVTDPDAYGKNFQKYLKELQNGGREKPAVTTPPTVTTPKVTTAAGGVELPSGQFIPEGEFFEDAGKYWTVREGQVVPYRPTSSGAVGPALRPSGGPLPDGVVRTDPKTGNVYISRGGEFYPQ